MISVLFVKPSPHPFYPNVKHRLKHSSPASNSRAAGRGQIKHVGLILNKNTQPIEFTMEIGSAAFKK
jgi:hypothetical protein